MAPVLRCTADASLAPVRTKSPSPTNLRPTFVPLESSSSSKRVAEQDAAACLVGCDLTAAAATWAEPPAPIDLTFTLSGSTLTLSWSAGSGGGTAEGWVIEAGSSPGASDVARFSTGSLQTGFSATVAGNAVFYIRVRAVNRFFTGPPSNEIVVVIGTPTILPGPPQELTASASGSNVTLAWSPPATGGGVASYTIQAGSQPGASDLANFSTGSTDTTFFAAGVGAGAYFVRVRASNAAGIGDPSNEVLLLVGGGCSPPVPPPNLAATVNGSRVTLSWAPAAGATSYQLQVGSSAGATDLLDLDLQSGATALTAVNVGAGSYFVRLRSLNSCGQSAASNEIVVVVP
jgi:predicted phage tail protein